MLKRLALSALVPGALIGFMAVLYYLHQNPPPPDPFGGRIEEEKFLAEVGNELIEIHTFQSMIDVAKNVDIDSVETAADLAIVMRRAGVHKGWALAIHRVQLEDGSHRLRPVIVHPGEHGYSFENDKILMRILAGKPDKYGKATKLHVVPEELQHMNTRKAADQLLNGSGYQR